MTKSARSGPRRNARVRCAIYTRKSSEEGLDQEFNSLRAQREACEAFINSQVHEGWVCLRTGYDDGGSPAQRWIGRLCNGCSPTSRRVGSIRSSSTRSTGSPARWLILPRLSRSSMREVRPLFRSRVGWVFLPRQKQARQRPARGVSRGTESLLTLRWRGVDSNFESRFQKNDVPTRITASGLALLGQRELHRPRRGNPLPSCGESATNCSAGGIGLSSEAAISFSSAVAVD